MVVLRNVIHLFGIRHHGPGSARSLVQALEKLEPDCLLIEGPPEADGLIPHVLDEVMEPPVSLLLYAKDDAAQAVFYPFARYSPEWQALRFGAERGLATRFFDLSLSFRFAKENYPDAEDEADTEAVPETDLPSELALEAKAEQVPPRLVHDPLFYLAQAAGYEDSERWWGHMVEERLERDSVFEAILEAMSALREELSEPEDIWEQRREASMRINIRKAQKEGFERIAVICGAWHAPALKDLNQAKEDKALLKGLAKTKVQATWIPYTSGRLARSSGYGAGITSPGWYDHLWRYAHSDDMATRWLAKVARLLRDEDLEASSAQVIEGVRLAQTLAAMRGRASIGLEELNEAAYALFANGNDLILSLISEKLIVSNVLGSVSEQVPATPLQLDLSAKQKRLRLKVSADEKNLELDLRKDNDLARSQLLHRLNLLKIPWGNPQHSSGKGTFKEGWQLRWEPEFSVRLIEAGRYGQTIDQASSAKVKETALKADNIAELSELLDDTLLADLPEASRYLVDAIALKAAEDTDLSHLMIALPKLAHVLRYGDVRSSAERDVSTLEKVVQGIFTRICIGLPNACSSLADDAAEAMFEHLQKLHSTIKLLQDDEQTELWLSTLERLTRLSNTHALLTGRAIKILLDEAKLSTQEAAQRLKLALSDPNVEKAANWLEGFLKDGGLLLVHDDALFKVLDSWFETLTEDSFTRVLPLVRRTFSSFEAPERQTIGQKAKGGQVQGQERTLSLNTARGERILNHLSQLLGKPEAQSKGATK